MALSIFVPIGYITVLVVSLSIFSRVYRKRTAQALVREHGQPWFPEGHPERDIYQTLVQASSASTGTESSGNEGGQSVVPDVVLKAALLNRAMADVRRIIRLRDDKQALGVLLQKGSIGDETMAKFAMAEKELEAEILDVVSEANTFREGWGQLIFPTASEMVAHLKHKDIYYGIQQQREEEIKRLTDAGKSIPKPTVSLPPMITPAGTSITISAPNPPTGNASQQANSIQNATQKETAAATTIAANGTGEATTESAKSGTLEDAEDEAQAVQEVAIDPGALADYAALGTPNTLLAAVDDESAYGVQEDDVDYDSDCRSYEGPIELIFKDPTPNPSPEAAVVHQFFEDQAKKLSATASPDGRNGNVGLKKKKKHRKRQVQRKTKDATLRESKET